MKIKFTKLQGAGNDYLYIDAINDLPADIIANTDFYSKLALKISDRHFGVGSDGVIVILPSENKQADFKMRMFNADGSEGEMCGNGIRCFAKYVHDYALTNKNSIKIDTLAGIKVVEVFTGQQKARVEMGLPIFESSKIPVKIDKPEVLGEKLDVNINKPDMTAAVRTVNTANAYYSPDSLDMTNTFTFEIFCVSMGNPHCVIFVEDVDKFDVPLFGPLIENNPIFPKRINVEFVEVASKNNVKVRTWERGSGETLACGTGACAVYSVMKKTGRLANEEDLNVVLYGGTLQISGSLTEGIFMTGPAEEVFSGYYDFKI
jgi:diaminopimelate epimerase